MRRFDTRPSRRAASVLAALTVGIVLAGCTQAPEADTTATATAAAPTSSPTATAAVLVPDGTATDNLPLFSDVILAVAATDDEYHGRAYIDALVEAGFDRDAMEVTNDTTSVGNRADVIQFSVAWAGECLIGQVGPSTAEPTAVVAPQLPEGGCLIGETRPIDW